nr:zinc finger, CCHC-type [Tanacetum cinerariifolium]GEX44341.1 zinc finger, CCHC-type [Tanacetum cinerariifolium]
IEDEDQALMLLTSLPSSYKNSVETLLYGREFLTMKDVLAILNSRSDHSGKAHSGGSLWFKLRGRTGKLKYFICHSEGHLKRDCPTKKSSGFVKKGKRDHDSNSSDNEGNTYFGEALVVVRDDETTELVRDSGGSYHMTHMRDFLYDFKVVDGGLIQLDDGLRRSLISLGTLEKEVYTVKMQMGRIKVSNDDATMAQKWLEDMPLEKKTNTKFLIKEREKVHLGIKVEKNIMVTRVPSPEGAKGNVVENKKVKKSMEANLENY